VAGVYSTRLLIANSNGVWTAYVVPVGKRAVVMTCLAYNAGAATAQVLVAVGGWSVWGRSVPVGASVLDVNMRLVAYAQEQIEGRPSGAGTAIIVAGYLFDESALARRDERWAYSSGPADLDSVTGESPR
jgi:hypothetical protein